MAEAMDLEPLAESGTIPQNPAESSAATNATTETVEKQAAGDGAEEEDDDELGEDEYEIEAILSHEVGRFAPDKLAYLVSWKGYGEDDNSWVKEEDAVGAQEMLQEYWKKNGGKQNLIKKAAQPLTKGKKGRKSGSRTGSASSPAASSSKRKAKDLALQTRAASNLRGGYTRGAVGQAAGPIPPAGYANLTSGRRVKGSRELEMAPSRSPSVDSIDESADPALEAIANNDELSPEEKARLEKEHLEKERLERMKKKYERIPDWDPIVRKVETVERSASGKLIVFLLFNSGDRLAFEAPVCHHRCPGKVIAFYESHLRFKTTDGMEEFSVPPQEKQKEKEKENGEQRGEENGDKDRGESGNETMLQGEGDSQEGERAKETTNVTEEASDASLNPTNNGVNGAGAPDSTSAVAQVPHSGENPGEDGSTTELVSQDMNVENPAMENVPAAQAQAKEQEQTQEQALEAPGAGTSTVSGSESVLVLS